MAQVFKVVGRVAMSDAPVMITGETGSGKELVARAVHTYSQRNGKSFVAINCAAIPEQLLESELFGHEKGAFTGAVGQRAGRFEQCNGGTLFLDEIGDMPLALQSKILRVLQDGEFSRVGGSATLKGDVRIIAATNKNLEQEVAEKKFREDLFYRLNVVRIQLPPLRQRAEDIRLLAEYFLQKVAARQRLPRLKISEDAIKVLEGHNWPGNVRELQNVVERAAILAEESVPMSAELMNLSVPQSAVAPAPVPASSMSAPASNGEIVPLHEMEKRAIFEALEKTDGNRTQAAELLQISIRTLRNKLAEYRGQDVEE
jgi:transcriptional regulator with GAF, ATPase, and Fis domain